jgi:hypothetical protein
MSLGLAFTGMQVFSLAAGPVQAPGHALDAKHFKHVKHLDQAQPAASKRLLVHNLFAMEAISIAEAHGVPTLALSPCLVPQVAPADLQCRFERKYPALHAALTRPGKTLRYSESGAAVKNSLFCEDSIRPAAHSACLHRDSLAPGV